MNTTTSYQPPERSGGLLHIIVMCGANFGGYYGIKYML